ncbi:MAG: hypothetical protein ACYCST_21130, partial [Acidimicrobiales bacterium]
MHLRTEAVRASAHDALTRGFDVPARHGHGHGIAVASICSVADNGLNQAFAALDPHEVHASVRTPAQSSSRAVDATCADSGCFAGDLHVKPFLRSYRDR